MPPPPLPQVQKCISGSYNTGVTLLWGTINTTKPTLINIYMRIKTLFWLGLLKFYIYNNKSKRQIFIGDLNKQKMPLKTVFHLYKSVINLTSSHNLNKYKLIYKIFFSITIMNGQLKLIIFKECLNSTYIFFHITFFYLSSNVFFFT